MPEEAAKPKKDEMFLLWDCFVNWSITLEKIEKTKISK